MSKDKDLETIWLDTFDSDSINLTQIGNIVIDSTSSMSYDYWNNVIHGSGGIDILTIDTLTTDSDYTWTQNLYPTHQELVFQIGGDEMLKITQEGFYVRGVKVEQDSKEAQTVYEAFRRWQTAQILNSTDGIIIK